MNLENWHNWRGKMDERMDNHQTQLAAHEEEINKLNEKVGAILSKLAVPLFLVGIAACVAGGVLVAIIGKYVMK